MNKNITQSTQYGLYMVYLFKGDMTGFYLSLNQGITFFEKEYGKINELSNQFSDNSISENTIYFTFY